jgi:quinol monooxygenase YgiN
MSHPHTRPSRRGFLGMAVAAAGAALIGRAGRAAQPPAASRPLTAVTLIHGIPGREEELKQHLLTLAGPTRAEAGCLTYDLYQSPDRKHEFMRLEVWESAEALEAHKQAPHIRASFEKRQREGWTTEILPWRRVPEDTA